MRLNLNGVWDFYPNGGDERFDIVVPTWWDSLSRTTGYPEEWEKGLRHGVEGGHANAGGQVPLRRAARLEADAPLSARYSSTASPWAPPLPRAT